MSTRVPNTTTMKGSALLICIFIQILITSSKILPQSLPQLCSQSNPNYNECMETALKKWGPHLLKGISKLNFPRLNPLEIPTFAVNRTANEFVSMSVLLTNIKIWGFDTLDLKSFKLDPTTKEGQLHLIIYDLYPKMDYEATGKLFNIDLKSEGIFTGNASVIDLLFNFKLKKFEKLGIEYYGFEKFETKSSIDDGYVKIFAKNPLYQYTADLITNFFNENPKRTIRAVHSIYEESVNVFYKGLAEQFLSTIPADEFLPK